MTRQQLRVFLATFYCGCGAPREATASLMKILSLFEDEGRDARYDSKETAYEVLPKLVPDVGTMFLLLYLIDSLGVIEHGTGIRGSWLTNDGEALLVALRREAGDNFESLDASHCLHGYDVEGEHAIDHDCGAFEDANPDFDHTDRKACFVDHAAAHQIGSRPS